MNIFQKILTWIKSNGATVVATLQAALKAVKEILTGVVNLLQIVLPVSSAQVIVTKIRDVINGIDGLLEKIKDWLLQDVIDA